MAQWFRAHAAFTEDRGLVPATTWQFTCNSLRGSDALCWPPLVLHSHGAHTPIHITKILSFLSKKRTGKKSRVVEHLPSMHVHEAMGFVLGYSTTKN